MYRRWISFFFSFSFQFLSSASRFSLRHLPKSPDMVNFLCKVQQLSRNYAQACFVTAAHFGVSSGETSMYILRYKLRLIYWFAIQIIILIAIIDVIMIAIISIKRTNNYYRNNYHIRIIIFRTRAVERMEPLFGATSGNFWRRKRSLPENRPYLAAKSCLFEHDLLLLILWLLLV